MKKNMKKVILTVLSVALIVALSVTATLAWLQDTTEPVVNTFTEGKVDIDLFEHQYDLTNNSLTNTEIRGDATVAGDEGNSYKMIPGAVLPKDPTVEVLAVSEACWLFVKIEEINNIDTFLSYAIADGWTVLNGTVDNAENPTAGDETIVIYRTVADTDADQTFAVLKDNQVTVNTSVDMDDMNALKEDTRPQLKFTAYAIQSANLTDTNDDGKVDAADAWAALNPNS